MLEERPPLRCRSGLPYRAKLICRLTACLWIAGSLHVSAQDTVKVWSLQECIDYAGEHSIQVQMRQVEMAQGEINLNTARNQRLPNLTANMSQQFSFGRSASGYDNTYQDRNSSAVGLTAATSVPLFSGFRITNEIAASQLNLKVAAAELEKAKNDLEINIAALYLQALYGKELLGVAKLQASLSREQWERLQVMYKNGRASEAQLYEAEAQIAADELQTVQATSDLQMALLSLTQALELPTPEYFDVEEPAGEAGLTLARKPATIYATALTTRASIRAEELRLQSSEKNIRIAQSAYYPTLSFGAGLSNNYYSINGVNNPSLADQLKNNRNEYFGLSLYIPVFNRLATRNSVRIARLNRQLQSLNLDNVKKTLYKEIQQAWYNAAASSEKYKSAEVACKSAEKAFGYMQEKFNSGRATIYEYKESRTAMMRAFSNRTQAKYDFLFRQKILEFYEKQ